MKKSHCMYKGIIYASPRKALDAAKVLNAHKKAGKLLIKMRKAGGTVEFEGHTFTEVEYGTAVGQIAEWVGPQLEAITDRDAKKLKSAGMSADDANISHEAQRTVSCPKGMSSVNTRPGATLADNVQAEIFHDAEKSRYLETTLRAYTEQHLVTGTGCFKCQHARECRSSLKADWTLVTGESPYIGPKYDLRDKKGRNFRIVFVGKERGGDDVNFTIDGARQRLNGFVQRDAESKHLRGCYLATTRLLFGVVELQRESLQVNCAPVHVSKCFSLINALSCSAKPPGTAGTRKAAPTRTMKDNCGVHLYEMLQAVEPTVVVVQGDAAHKYLSRRISGLRNKPRDLAFIAELNGRKVVFCSFSHPSARPSKRSDKRWWKPDQPYAREVVGPQLDKAREWLVSGEVM